MKQVIGAPRREKYLPSGVVREGASVLRSKYYVCKMLPWGELSECEALAALTCLFLLPAQLCASPACGTL